MDYTINTHDEFVKRVDEYLFLMKQAKYEKQKPFSEQDKFLSHYGKVKDSIIRYVKDYKYGKTNQTQPPQN